MNLSTGIISTVAGTDGRHGTTGDNGPATSALLGGPEGVALDGQGNLFIADDNNVVYRVSLEPPSLSNVSPSSGTVQGGGEQKITWTSSNVSNVDILLSTNGSTFGTTIASNVPNTGDYGWSVPNNLATTMAEIEVVDHAAMSVTAQSSGTFTISQPTGPIISTFAGPGNFEYSGDGGQAVDAGIDTPSGVALDSQGNLFIADTDDNVIREVNASTHVITTVAGNGTSGSTGLGGLATSAELAEPYSVAVDSQDDLFITENNTNVVLEVNSSTGDISIVAGMYNMSGGSGDNGQATNATLNGLLTVAVDGQNHLFIADQGNNDVREVNLSSGIITNVAGTGLPGTSGDGGQATAAELSTPTAVTVDNQGNLFIADNGNYAIREVNLSSGMISTVAGTLGHFGTTGDGGPATTAKLSSPYGVAVDSTGDIFISDQGDNVVREVSKATGDINLYAGTYGQFGDSGDNAPATSAVLRYPQGLAVDSQGNLYIADNSNDAIRRVSPLAESISGVQVSTATVQGGGNAVVTWTSTGVSNVDILLSTNGSTFGTTIASNVPNIGGYTWNVPISLSTTMGKIEVVDHADSSVSSTSSGTFTVASSNAAILSTFAGNGTGGTSGDGGLAVSAELALLTPSRWTARATSSSPTSKTTSSRK